MVQVDVLGKSLIKDYGSSEGLSTDYGLIEGLNYWFK